MNIVRFSLLYFASIFVTKFQATTSSNILVVHTVFSTSHILTLKSLVDSLIATGHTVFVIKWKDDKVSPYDSQQGKRLANLSVTTLAMNNEDGRFSGLTKEKQATFQFPDKLVWSIGTAPGTLLFAPEWRQLFPFFAAHCETLWGNKVLADTLRTKKFDLAIVDFIWNECSLAWVRHALHIPIVVGFWGISGQTLQTDAKTTFLASSQFTTLAPRTATGDAGVTSKLKRRVLEFCHNLLAQVVMQIHFSFIESVVQKYSAGADNSIKLQQGLDGVLINYDDILELSPRPLPSHFVSIGGMHILTKHELRTAEIPAHISQWLDVSAEHRATIFFSFGFTLNSADGPKHIFESFLAAFTKLTQQRVLFQYTGDSSNLTIPENVKVVGWVPQQIILAHPNTKLFVSHCGLQGVTEAVFYGVPILCMPIVTDGFETLTKIVAKNIGIGLDLNYLTETTISDAIEQIFSTNIYKINVQKYSRIMKTRRETPRAKATNFINDLLRANGSYPKFDILAQDQLSVVEYFYFDVLVALAICFFVTKKVFLFMLGKMKK